MGQENRLRRREDFNKVLSIGHNKTDRYLVLKSAPGGRISRIGLVISKKTGGAVERNRIRRRLREILRRVEIKPGTDLVFIARQPVRIAHFAELESSVRGLLQRAGLIKIENEKTGPGANQVLSK